VAGIVHWFGLSLRHAEAWTAILRGGYFNAVDPHVERQAAFWFAVFTPALIALGFALRHAASQADTELLALCGWTLLAIGVFGAAAIPISSFWLVIAASVPPLLQTYQRVP
jgi:hypothetical protein